MLLIGFVDVIVGALVQYAGPVIRASLAIDFQQPVSFVVANAPEWLLYLLLGACERADPAARCQASVAQLTCSLRPACAQLCAYLARYAPLVRPGEHSGP